MSQFSVDVLTPSRVLFRNHLADQLFVPTGRGEINILPEHTHLMADLDSGILSLVNKGKREQYYVQEGVCKVLHDRVIILAQEAFHAHELEIKELNSLLTQARLTLKESSLASDDYDRVLKNIYELEMKLKFLGHRVV